MISLKVGLMRSKIVRYCYGNVSNASLCVDFRHFIQKPRNPNRHEYQRRALTAAFAPVAGCHLSPDGEATPGKLRAWDISHNVWTSGALIALMINAFLQSHLPIPKLAQRSTRTICGIAQKF